MNSSIPDGLPKHVVDLLVDLKNDFKNGYLTEKGYIKKRVSILSKIVTPLVNASQDVFSSSDGMSSHHRAYSVASNLTRNSTIGSSKKNIDGGYSPAPPAVNVELQKPLDPRVLSDLKTGSNFENLAAILRNRWTTYQKETALLVLDSKGKETSNISWEKLYLKAEKVAQQIRDKSGLYKNDRVCLIYQNTEVVEFQIALFGCFLAGVVAVPITLDFKLNEMIHIMTVTQSHLCLTTDMVLKYLDKKLNSQTKLKWPKGLEFWKTTDIGTYHPNKREAPVLQVPDLAYIEFVRSPDGDLNGVAISHKTMMQQMNMLVSILSSNPNYDGKSFKRKDISYTRHRNVMLSILDARKSVGLIVGTLLNVFTGNLLIWTSSQLLDIAGLYANVITKYDVTVLLNDYLNLKQVVYNYQSFPQYTRKFSKTKVDFSKVKWVLIYTSIVDGEFHEILTNRWLKPLGCKNVDNIVAPLLTLSEFGGMVISMRDWIGEEDKLNTQIASPTFEDDEFSKNISSLSEVLIDKKSLTTNTVKVISDRPPPITENFRSTEFLRIGSFGYPLPDATLAIVNPETCYLAPEMEVGEIWIDSVSLPGGFWGTSEGTQNIFHARCRDHEGVLDLEFLRTGLLGFTYNGKVYVLGLYEDRLRQRITYLDKPVAADQVDGKPQLEYKYHYSDHLAYTLARAIPQRRVSDSSAFDVLFNNEYLPVVVIESPAAVPNLQGSVDIQELDLVATKSFIVLERYHNVRPYCILILPPNTLPRTIKSGIPGIANMMCKRHFLEGNLRSVYVKYNIKRSITEIPRSKYYLDSIWSESVSNFRYKSLLDAEEQFSGLDYRDTSIDDRTKKPLTDFDSILDILNWRIKHQADELAFTLISRNANKQYSWKKFENKIAGVISLISDKMRKGKLRFGDRIGLMFTLCEDFVSALYACWFTGLIPIPLNPIDTNRIRGDLSNLTDAIRDYKIVNIFVNNDSEYIIKNKPVAPVFKQNVILANVKIRNTSKVTTKGSLSSYLQVVKRQNDGKKIENDQTAIILLNYSEDEKRTGTALSMNNIASLCKILKETCQLESKNPIISCIRHTIGIGFIQTALIGVYIGSSTYLFPPVEFATNPNSFFLALSRYKVKDVYVTEQMLEYAMKTIKSYDFSLERINNLMVGYDGRPNTELIKKVATRFSSTKLNSSSISHVYTHYFNPMITLRSYLSFDPIDLWIDPAALRLGLISIVNPSNFSNAIHVQDSGIVPVCTQVAIVNPETRKLCKIGEIGEIWVCSEANISNTVHKFGQPSNSYDKYQFNAKIVNGDDSLLYVRTGDLGFLHNVSRYDKNSGTLEFQPLFLLGPISFTFESMGLMHFVTDIESSIEGSHYDIRNGGACVFKADGFIIAIIDTSRAKYLSSLVPVIFNKVLSDHNLILDIVAFTKPGEFPYSKLGVKQRGNIVEKFTAKKLGIQAQYGLNYGEESLIKTVEELENIKNSATPIVEKQ